MVTNKEYQKDLLRLIESSFLNDQEKEVCRNRMHENGATEETFRFFMDMIVTELNRRGESYETMLKTFNDFLKTEY